MPSLAVPSLSVHVNCHMITSIVGNLPCLTIRTVKKISIGKEMLLRRERTGAPKAEAALDAKIESGEIFKASSLLQVGPTVRKAGSMLKAEKKLKS